MVVAAGRKVLAAVKPGSTAMVINLAEVLPGEFVRNPEFSLPTERIKRTISSLAGAGNSHFVDASRLATALLGQSLGANMFMLGYAWQIGALPLSAESIERAIGLNGEAVDMNHAAFRWGRRAAVDLAAVEALAKPATQDPARALSTSLDDMIGRRAEFLTAYQDAAYAARYRRRVEAVRDAENARAPGKSGLAEAVARYLFKLMAYKDEYEVARLYADPAFLRQVRNEVDGDNLRLTFHLAPPLLARRNKTTGEPVKMSFGPWMLSVFGVLAKLKFLRGTALDPFGYTAERRTERQLVRDYETLLDELTAKLSPENYDIAVGLAAIPEKIRGFGHVKQRHLAAAKSDEAALMEQFRAGGGVSMLKAAE
jgi:indolepyruvate ferredoxin oxidoreductase